MGKKNQKAKAKKLQKKVMRKKQKDKRRHKSKSASVASENSVQHQMISTFGNVQNFVRTVQNLGQMFKEDEDLVKIRLDPEKIYEKIDLAEMREPLADMYKEDDLTVYDEQYEDVWKAKRKEVLEDLLAEEFVEHIRKTFEKLLQTKKGHKKEYRAAMAGKLLVESHLYSLTEAPINENSLWEIIFNAAIKENKKELPEPAPPEEKPEEGSEGESVEAEPKEDVVVREKPEEKTEAKPEPVE